LQTKEERLPRRKSSEKEPEGHSLLKEYKCGKNENRSRVKKPVAPGNDSLLRGVRRKQGRKETYYLNWC